MAWPNFEDFNISFNFIPIIYYRKDKLQSNEPNNYTI